MRKRRNKSDAWYIDERDQTNKLIRLMRFEAAVAGGRCPLATPGDSGCLASTAQTCPVRYAKPCRDALVKRYGHVLEKGGGSDA